MRDMGVRAWLGFGGGQAPVRMPAERPIASFSIIGPDDMPSWAASGGAAGPRITREQALAVPAVLKGRNLIAGTLSTLPICTVDSALNRVRVPLFEQIDPDVPNGVTMAQTVEDLLFEAIAWWQVLARGYDGFPVSARHIDPRNVTFQMPSTFPINRLPSGYYPGSHVFILSTLEAVPARDIIRFDSPNPPLLVAAARAIRRALKHELAADNYADNPQAREYFTPAEDADPADEEPSEDATDKRSKVTKILDAWAASRRIRTTGYVPASLKLNQVEQLSPVDLQMSQLIDKDVRDIANAMGLDPEDLGVSTTSRTYQNAVDRRIDKVNECFAPYITAIEGRLSMGDVTRRGQRVWLDLSKFLKANPVDMASIQKIRVDMGSLTDDEVRFAWDQPPLTPAQRKQLTPAPVAPPKPEHSNLAGVPGLASVTSIGSRTAVSHHADAAAVTFSAAPPALIFDLSDVPNRFSVNQLKRTITGLVMPWGKIGRSDGRRWKFAKDSLQYDPAQVNRILLLDEHDNSQILGRATKTWSDEVGQWAVFKVARGKSGDRALHRAKEGTKTGLSAGVGYQGEHHGLTFGADPSPDGLGPVMYVTAAPWRETSQVAMPAFDDARVSAVAMAADKPSSLEGNLMKCTICGQEHAPGIACPQAPAPAATFAAPDNTQLITDAIAAGFAALRPVEPVVEPVTDPVVDVDARITTAITSAFAAFSAQGPTVVSPARPAEVAQVSEPPLYRFDGGKAQRCFSADLAKVMDKDPEVTGIVNKYMAEEMAAQFANITPTNVAALNPVPTRPELFVPNLSFPRPLGSLVTPGTLDNLVAFIVPQFASASGMVGTHTPGTEPTQGAFAATSQTVTPKGLSGRVDLDREIIDAGGNPQADQVIYGEMVRAWNDQLEERIVDMFQAMSLTDTPIAGTNGDLQAALNTLFASFQFIRGGDRFGSFGLHQDLYAAIANAVDGMDRPLFPMVGAQNSDGTVSQDLSQVRVGAKVGLPAWALASGNNGPDKSFLWSKPSVYQWASAPRRFTFDQVNVSSVGIGIWGYSAEACTRATDVYQLAYSIS